MGESERALAADIHKLEGELGALAGVRHAQTCREQSAAVKTVTVSLLTRVHTWPGVQSGNRLRCWRAKVIWVRV